MDASRQRHLLLAMCLAIGSAFVAWFSARDHAGSWNDGSRLATVESLVDRRTFMIDDSIFVRVPGDGPAPYVDELLLRNGTMDKLQINGHFYSDKSPVPALAMTALYQGWRWMGGAAARTDPQSFCTLMTRASSALAYVAAVLCLYLLCSTIGLRDDLKILVTVAFALSTIALAYCQYVNNHILLLGVAMALTWQLVAQANRSPKVWPLVGLGALAGLAYAIDLGAGPILFVATLALVCYRHRAVGPIAVFAASALPCILLNHAVNYWIGGTFKPANAVPEYLQWPGSPFHAENMTGSWNHASLTGFIFYALDMLFGKKGFLLHNLPVLLAVVGIPLVVRTAQRLRPEVVHAAVWSLGTWGIYALTSTNHSGLCCSIRWFVPLLAPAFLIVALLLKHRPEFRSDLILLGSYGAVLGILAAWQGPWAKHMVPMYWPLVALALSHWAVLAWRRLRVGSGDGVWNMPRRARAA